MKKLIFVLCCIGIFMACEVALKMGKSETFGSDWTKIASNDLNDLPLKGKVSISKSGKVTVTDLTKEGPHVVLCKVAKNVFLENLVYYEGTYASTHKNVKKGDKFTATISGTFMFGCSPELNCWKYRFGTIQPVCGNSEGEMYRTKGVDIVVE